MEQPTPEFRKTTENFYKINFSSDEELKEIVSKLAKFFEEPDFYHKDIFDTIQSGQSWRFQGVFNLSILKDQLVLDNRNGRGVKQYEDQFQEAIKSLQ